MDLADSLRFDPAAGTVVRRAPGAGYGYWAGGHKVTFDQVSRRFVMFYRLRSPLEEGRGYAARVATSEDGVVYEDEWEVTKAQLAAASIEVGHVVRHAPGEWRCYLSYQEHGSNRWRIDVIRGESLTALDPQTRRTVLHPGDYDLPWIKDPVVYRASDGSYRVLAAVPARTWATIEGDVVTARPLDATVLAESADGLVFPRLRYVFEAPGDDTWHGRRARLNSLFEVEGTVVATFDGGRTFYDNYEEWAGLAVATSDGRFEALPMPEPWVRSPYGSVRYVYGLRLENRIWFTYEYTRADGAHDLRVAIVDL